MAEIFGVVLLTGNKEINNLSLFGKAVFEWVRLSLGEHKSVLVPYREDKSEPFAFLSSVKAVANPASEYTVVLFSDTPLITTSTISDAVSELNASGGNVLMLTRGFVFKTDFLLGCERLYSPPHFYTEEEDFLTLSDFSQLSLVGDILKNRILKHHMKNGVAIYDACTTFIDADVSIGSGAQIRPFNVIKGACSIAGGATLLEGNSIEGCVIEDGVVIGPYARIRPQSIIGSGAKIGNFVEIKNCKIGSGTKISHLAYCGDATIGSNCNIGCGVVVANYDGKKKHQTIIGNNVFVGSNANLVAPITLSDNCFIAAGSTITDDVPPDMLAIARARQENKIRKKTIG